jgi:hypothetical protein
MERRKRTYRVSIEPPLDRASGGVSSNALYGRIEVSRQTSMSYPGQGRPPDALGSSDNKAKPGGKNPGRSKPSTQENVHLKRKRSAARKAEKDRSR